MACTHSSVLFLAELIAVGLLGQVWAQGIAMEIASLDELLRAVDTPGVEHILYTRHVDWSNYNVQTSSDAVQRFYRAVKTVQGNCTYPPTVAGVRHVWKPGQCLITQAGTYYFAISNQALWVSSLYFRKVSAAQALAVGGTAGTFPLFYAQPNSSLYLTDVTFQGDDLIEDEGASQMGLAGQGLLVAAGANVYASGCAFVGHQVASGAGVLAVSNNTLSFFNSTFLDNHAVGAVNLPSSDPSDPPYNRTGTGGGIAATGLSTRLRLEQCAFQGNSAEDARTDDIGVEGMPGKRPYVYSDGPERPVYGTFSNYTTYTLPLNDAATAGFLTVQDEWLLAAKAAHEAAVSALQAAKDPPSPPPGRSVNMAIVGAVGGLVAGILLAALTYILVRKLKARPHTAAETSEAVPVTHSDWDGMALPDITPFVDATYGLDQNGAAFTSLGSSPHMHNSKGTVLCMHSAHTGLSSGGTITIVDNVTLDLASRLASTTGAKVDPEQALLDVLEQLAVTGTPFLGLYEILGFTDCRCGGQGVVQFARHRYSHEEHAVKFYFDHASFQREADLFARPELQRMMPAVIRVEANADGGIRASPLSDYAFPPFIILERGQALDEWAAPRRPDAALSIGVFMHITERLRDLHKHNVVHRDLKPSNIIWRPQQTEWTLIDYGCSADSGHQVPMAFTLSYAAPEILQGFRAGARVVIADPTTDVWALGLIAWELFTASPCAFGAGTPPEYVTAQILGEQPAPWETGHPDYAANEAALQDVGHVKRLVVQCLSRQPAARPTADELCRALVQLFTSATTT